MTLMPYNTLDKSFDYTVQFKGILINKMGDALVSGYLAPIVDSITQVLDNYRQYSAHRCVVN